MTLSFNAAALDFGIQRVGTTSAAAPVVVTNLGADPVRLSLSGFTITPDTFVSGVTSASIAFAPTAVDTYSGTLAGGLTLTGRGASVGMTPANLTFGDQPVGSTETKYVQISYDVAGGVAPDGSLSGLSAPFSIESGSVSVASGKIAVAVTFAPTSAGPFGPVTLTFQPAGAIAGATSSTCSVSGTGVTVSAIEKEAEAKDDFVHTGESDDRYGEGGVYYQHGTAPTGGEKYWEVELDHYFSGDSRRLNSYLRLGSAEPNSKLVDDVTRNDDADRSDARGHDLAAMIVGFRDDIRDRGKGDSGYNSDFETVAQRQDESKKLHKRGGWRDHSDGNRISTTRGDKIEVVQGNYHMLVLGRFDERGDGARIETSGGHVVGDTETETPGAVMEVKWRPELYGGTWRIVQETVKGDTVNRYHGNVENYYFGNSQLNVTGSSDAGTPIEGPATIGEKSTSDSMWVSQASDAADKIKKANPSITSKTWASKIESYTGSIDCWVPHVFSLTFAEAIESVTTAISVVSATEAGSVLSQTAAGSIIGLNTAAVDIVAVNASPLGLTLNAVIAQADFKYGTYFSYGTNKTYVHADSTTIEGGQTVLSVTQDTLTGIDTKISETNNRIDMSNNLVSASVMALVEDDYSLGATKAFVYAETLVGI